MQALSDQSRAALVKNPNGAEQVARELDLQLVRAEKVGMGSMIPGIGASRELDDALVSLRKGEVSSVVQIAPTKLAVAVITDVFPARQAEISEVEGQIRETLTGEKLAVLVEKRVAEAADKAKALNGNLKAGGAVDGAGAEDTTRIQSRRRGGRLGFRGLCGRGVQQAGGRGRGSCHGGGQPGHLQDRGQDARG